jgi:hypothetical protein
MLARFFQAAAFTTVVVLLKRLFIRRKPTLPYRRADSDWPQSYRKPS